MNDGPLKIITRGEREIIITRFFRAPRHLVYRAWTEPKLISRWLGVFGEWNMRECEVDLRVDGRYRYVWSDGGDTVMGMGGTYREIVENERIVTTEQFDEPWYPGEAVGTVVFEDAEGGTLVTTTIVYESGETRDAVLRTPMESGMEAGYQTLDRLLANG